MAVSMYFLLSLLVSQLLSANHPTTVRFRSERFERREAPRLSVGDARNGEPSLGRKLCLKVCFRVATGTPPGRVRSLRVRHIWVKVSPS